jgi:hypothetical protein
MIAPTAKSNQLITTLIRTYRKKPVVRLYVTLTMSFLTISFFLVFAIRPTAVTISGLIRDLSAYRKLSADLDQKISAVFAAQSVYMNASSQLVLLDEAIPKTPTMMAFVDQINLLAASRQITLKSIAVDEFSIVRQSDNKTATSSTAAAVTYPFVISASGAYSSLYGFLEDLGQLRRIISPQTVTFQQVQSDTGSSISMNISGTVISMPEPTN